MSDQRPTGEGDWGDPLPPSPPPGNPAGYQQPPPPAYQQPPPPAYQNPGYPQGYGGQAPPPVAPPGGPKIDNFLVPSILATILCCLPTGIAAIVFSSQVNTKLSQGDVAGAQDSAAKARLWTFISVGAGLLVAGIYLVLVMAEVSTV